MVKAIAWMCFVTLTGCTTVGGSFCAIEHPIRLARAEVETLSDASTTAILAHNEKGAKLCGWKA
ncbi:MAG: hypothetical protein EOS17_16940 [Mesorhizobium sp.]|nr:MAG: hypothetical protein EOS17_16940 [Mesorhizobium sp.]